MIRVFIDTSVLLEIILDQKGRRKAEKILRKCKSENTEIQGYISHNVIGEAHFKLANIYSSDEKDRIGALELLSQLIEKLELITPHLDDINRAWTRVKRVDEHMKSRPPIDAHIVSTSLTEGCDKIYVSEEEWSLKDLIEVEKIN